MSWPLGSTQTLLAVWTRGPDIGITAVDYRVMVNDAGTTKYLQADLFTWSVADHVFAGTIVGGHRSTYVLGAVPALPPGCTEILWEASPTPDYFPVIGRTVEVPYYSLGYRITLNHLTGDGLVRVTITPLLFDAAGNVYKLSEKPHGAAVITLTPFLDVYKHTATGAPALFGSANMTVVAGTGGDVYESTFINLVDLAHYSFTPRFGVDGVLVAPASHQVTVGHIISNANGNVLDLLVVNAGQVVLGGNTKFVVAAGEESGEDVWEESIKDGNVRTVALGQFAAPKLAPNFAPTKTIEVEDRRPPEFFTPGRNYTLDNGGRGGDGVWQIVDVQPITTEGGARSKLVLNKRVQNVLDDLISVERRIEKTERGF